MLVSLLAGSEETYSLPCRRALGRIVQRWRGFFKSALTHDQQVLIFSLDEHRIEIGLQTGLINAEDGIR